MKFSLILLASFFPLLLLSQGFKLDGNIIDDDSETPLPGTSIIIKNTSLGYISDFDGNFEINVNLGDTLVFSYLGMEDKEIIALYSPITVRMQSKANDLDEVIVSVGYFDVSRKDLSGSIVQIGSDKLERSRSYSVESLLQGQSTGVLVTENSEPGGGFGVSIRGVNSMLGGTQPLFVLDGIPVDPLVDAEGNSGSGQQQSSLGFLNPDDIEKIEILKDAAATAIYGARGANGVVLITSKTADRSEGIDRISVTYDSSISDVTKTINVLDGNMFENFMNQRYLNQLFQDITNPNREGGNPFDGSQEISEENYPNELFDFSFPYPESTGINTDWQSVTYRLAKTNSLNFNYRGGDFSRNISISLGLLDQEGVIINSFNNRLTYNMNAKRQAFEKKVDFLSKTNISYNRGNAASVGNGEIFSQRGVVSQALQFQPIFSLLSPGEDDDIYAALNEGNIVSNPYTLAKDVIDEKNSISLRQVFSVIGRINPKFTTTIKGSYNYQRSSRDNYYPTNTTRGRINGGEASQAFIENSKIYSEANIRYRNRFGAHRLDAILISTFEKNKIRSLFNKAVGFGSDNTKFYNLTSANEIFVPISQFREVALFSGLFRVGYNYKRKYYIDINTRYDASSKFAINNKSAIFPSIALSWRLSNEKWFNNYNGSFWQYPVGSFIRKNISEIKFRFSYGLTGSNPIAPYQSLALLSPIRYNFNDELVTGYYESNLANDDLTWEKTEQLNIGLDSRFFNSKLVLTIDAYKKITNDLLQNVKLPVSNGYTSRIDNFGKVENKGLELSLNASIINTDDFSWEFGSNLSFNRNKLLELNSNLDYQLGPFVGFTQANPILFKVGKPLGIFWGAQTDGIYATWDSALSSGIEGAAPGEIKYINNFVDKNDSGDAIGIQQINFEDYVQIGDPNPNYTFSFSNQFNYQNWNLDILFTGQEGGDIFWVDSWQLRGLQKTTNVLLSSFQNSWKAPLKVVDGTIIYDSSIGNTSDATEPGAIIDNGPRAIVSDRQIYDGTFIRLKNINLSYSFNLKNNSRLTFYISGKNLFTWTNYPGYDPEVKTYVKNPQKRGVDFGTYPGTKTYLIGLKFIY